MTSAPWTLQEHQTEGVKVHITFECAGPARFELIVDAQGDTVLFGYAGIERNEEQEPALAFDTDGSRWIDPEYRGDAND